MKIVIDRTFSFEIYFIVKTWRRAYRQFNRIFCNASRPISFAITDYGVRDLQAHYLFIERPEKGN